MNRHPKSKILAAREQVFEKLRLLNLTKGIDSDDDGAALSHLNRCLSAYKKVRPYLTLLDSGTRGLLDLNFQHLQGFLAEIGGQELRSEALSHLLVQLSCILCLAEHANCITVQK